MKYLRVLVYGFLGILALVVLFYNPSNKNTNGNHQDDTAQISTPNANINSQKNNEFIDNPIHYEYKRNPFELAREDVIIKGEEPTMSVQDLYGLGGSYSSVRNKTTSGGLSLQSIAVVGNKRSAIINGEVLGIGSRVYGYRVVSIGSNGVVLSSGGKSMVLKVKD